MLTFKSGTDSHSLDIIKDGIHVGYLQWHKGKEPHITMIKAFSELTIEDLEQVIQKYKSIK